MGPLSWGSYKVLRRRIRTPAFGAAGLAGRESRTYCLYWYENYQCRELVTVNQDEIIRQELRDFLRARRARIAPADIGLPAAGRGERRFAGAKKWHTWAVSV